MALALGTKRLVCLCKRLCLNFNYYATGLPDLVLFRKEHRDDGNPSVLFVEVKGENDRLSEKQIDWIEFFQQNSINFELCKVNADNRCNYLDFKRKGDWNITVIRTNPCSRHITTGCCQTSGDASNENSKAI